MVYRRHHPPLSPVEKALIDAFCIASPCPPLRALFRLPLKDEERDAFYAACSMICTCVHFCPLEGGTRYRISLPPGAFPLPADTDAGGPAPPKRKPHYDA